MNQRLPWILAIGCWVLGALLAACGTAVTPATPITLRVAGSTAMMPLLSDLATAYAQSHPHVRLEIEGGGSRLGLERLQMGEIDLAGCSWLPPSAEEGTPQPYVATPIAWDGIAIVVHPSNPVDELTLLQVRSIYAGWTLDWQEVGGKPGNPLVVSREDGSGTRAALEQQLMGEQPVTLTAIVMPSSEAVVEYVARHTAAIGYASMAYVNDQMVRWSLVRWSGGPWSSSRVVFAQQEPPDHSTIRPFDDLTNGPLVKVLRIEGAYPMPDTVQGGIYHLTRPLYLVAPSEPDGEARAFVDFVLSPAGQAIVGQQYGRVW
jgi:phosphate transport system substrate-binding protein